MGTPNDDGITPHVGEVWYPIAGRIDIYEWVYIEFAEGPWVIWRGEWFDNRLGPQHTEWITEFQEKYRP